jgi:CubicO group peptidase (beta-lactamase class C family)
MSIHKAKYFFEKSLACPVMILMALTLLLLFGTPAEAQEEAVTTAEHTTSPPSPAHGPTDPAELETFLDGLMTRQMADYGIPGAAVAVVKDGEAWLAKGYGLADSENGVPVDPERSVFLIGSVGKLFTWTAVMQLVEQGKLDLDADINTYLDFRIPDTYPQPITLKHLLTHTAGFEDLYFEYLTLDAADQLPEGEWMASHIPARVRPPGHSAAYSNYGTQLAGYIVARVSGMPYEQYIQEYIYDPLGMSHSTAQSPVPPALLPDKAVGYMVVDDVLQPAPEFLGQPAMLPAGSHASSVADMARFMIAHLRDGHVADETSGQPVILSAATVEQMHSTLYTPDPRLQGTAYGLFDLSDNGWYTLGHDGDTLGFKAMILLMPDQHLGIFVAYNAEAADELTRQHFGFQRAFFDHYFPPAAVEPIQPPADFADRAARFEGSYLQTRSAHNTLEKYRNIAGGIVEISDNGDGTLNLGTPWGDWDYVEAAPLYFRQVDGPHAMLFREDDRGRISHVYIDLVPQFAFEKLNWYETAGFNFPLVLVCVLLFLSVIPVAIIRVVRSRRNDEGNLPSRGARAAFPILVAVCVLNILFVAGVVLWGEMNLTPLFGIEPVFKVVLGLGVVSAVLTLAALVYAVVAWKDGYWSPGGRVYYTLVVVAAMAFVWFLDFWNLLGWRF